jgi:hypothetical protein
MGWWRAIAIIEYSIAKWIQKTKILAFKVDKYANDSEAWKRHAVINDHAAQILFMHANALIFCFPAATPGLYVLEAYLKSALIRQGMTVFDPAKIGLGTTQTLSKADCVWGA